MKKLIATLLALTLLVLAILPIASFASQYVYATGNVHVRAWADKGASDMGVLYKGSSATYAGDYSYDYRGVKWYKVYWGNGTGWVSSMYSSLHNDSSYTPGYRLLHATGNVNVRSWASRTAADIGTLNRGETAVYAGEYSYDYRGVAWYKIYWGNSTGWVSSMYSYID